jgi:hypothetical protein
MGAAQGELWRPLIAQYQKRRAAPLDFKCELNRRSSELHRLCGRSSGVVLGEAGFRIRIER